MPSEDARSYAGERTEAPSEQGRERARRVGRAPVSREVAAFVVALAGVLLFYYAGAWMLMGAAGLMQRSFKAIALLNPGGMTVDHGAALLRGAAYAFAYLAAPVVMLPVAAALSYMAQNGFLAAPGALAPDAGRLNPFNGVKRLLSGAAAAKTLLKAAVIGYAVYASAAQEWGALPALVDMEPAGVMGYMGAMVFAMMRKSLWALFAIAALDYAYERWAFERSLRVTREELMAELRESEGDPALRERIRRAQQEAVSGRKNG
ncbi:MAG: EscU/YscU/HrcU family type III secretion system export apparatus switch protein [Deltaproteobacteria bacterium]|nr:EscU/YscU/HrcU family type III secretion system export apparatus switch protein [Deltaproteobacteria bacterium]